MAYPSQGIPNYQIPVQPYMGHMEGSYYLTCQAYMGHMGGIYYLN